MSSLFSLVLVFCLCLCSQTVNSCKNPPLGDLSPYNTVVFGDFDGDSSLIEGSFAAGGNVHFTDSSIGSSLPCESSSPSDSVIVGGSVSMGNGGTIFGNLVYGSDGSDASGTSFQCGGQPVQRNSSDFFKKLYDEAVSTSNSLMDLFPTGTPDKIGFGLVLNLSAGLDVNVFNSRSFISEGLGNIRIVGGNPNQTVVINVPSASIFNLLNVFWDFGDLPATNVLFNFPDARSMTGASLKGTILAPNAEMTYASGDFEGQLIVKGFSGRSPVIRQGLFCGCVPEPTTTSSSSGTTGTTGSTGSTGTSSQVLGARTTGTTGRMTTGSTGRTSGSTGTSGQVLGARTTGTTGRMTTGSTGLGTSTGNVSPCIGDLVTEVPESCQCFQSGAKCVCDCECCPV